MTKTNAFFAAAIIVFAMFMAPLDGAAVSGPWHAEIVDFAFGPEIEIEVGGSVEWRNSDMVQHAVTATDGSFSGTLLPGGTFTQAFVEPGRIAYFCAIHPAMTGTVLAVTATSAEAQASAAVDPPAEATILRRASVFDTDALGIAGEALTLLVPSGWSVEGGPVWRHQYANLATLEARVSSPDRLLGVEFFPLFPQIWQQGGIPFFPEGSVYLGSEVRQPIRDAATFLESLVLPAYRGSFSPRILERQAMPDVAAAYVAASLPGTEVIAERVLTEHFVAGERMLEEFTVVLTFTPNPYLPGSLLWSPQLLYAVRAPEARFEQALPVLQAIATSPVPNIEWYAGYEYVLGLSQQNGLDAIRAAGAASRIIADANAQVTDTIMRSYQEREAINDGIFERMSQTIRGVDTYTDPWAGGTLELPNGFEYVYASAEGSVILTNEPAFDPIVAFPEETWDAASVKR